MATQILATKLYIPPPRPKIVLRPRLLGQLNDVFNHRLTLISASAGFGKTTLVSEWVASCGCPVAWLSLDEGDTDITHFLTYFVAALQTVASNIGKEVLALLQSPQQPSTESILTALLNEITTIPDNFVLVLDDLHVVDSKLVDNVLAVLLEHQPPQMHLVVTTREDPQLPLARYRARGQLTELRAADLRFTPSEAAEFLNQVMGPNLSAEQIASLEARTEGWITGLQLAALSMQGREDIASFIQAFTGSHRFVLDYLVEEVLEHQPEHIRSFLLQTSILDRFCAPLCNTVAERGDGKELLDALERNNLFLIPLDDKRHWYRYHHLFAEVLQSYLREEQPDQVYTLHRRAGAWFEQNDLPADAIRHTLDAKDFERAANLIELAGPATEDGRIQPATWLGWVKRLPEELVRARPVLDVWYAYILLGSGELEAAESRFKEAERWLELAGTMKLRPGTSPVEMVVADKEQLKSLPATIAVGRAYIAQALGNIPDTVRYANRALELAPEGEYLRRGQASMLLGITYWANGDLESADQVFADYTMKLRTAGNIPDAISTAAVLADIRRALGRLLEAIETVEQCLHFVTDRGEPIPFDTADLHRALSELYLEQGNLEAAAHHLQRGMVLGEKAGLPVLRYRLCIAQARLKEAQGDPAGALALLDEAEHLFIRSPLPDFYPISAMKARLWVAQGRFTKVLEWAGEQGLSPDNDLRYLREFEHVTLARMLIAQYQKERIEVSIQAVIQFLDRLLLAAEEGRRMGSVIEILVLQALAHQAQSDITHALVPLERALTLAEPEGYVRVFVDEGEAMRLLVVDFRFAIEKSTLKGVHPLFGYVDKLLSAFPELVPTTPKSTIKNPTPLRSRDYSQKSQIIEPLSEHELEVLRLLKTELNGPEIARERSVSLSTIRTHTQHIYAKLGVNNRRAAVRRAEELGLL